MSLLNLATGDILQRYVESADAWTDNQRVTAQGSAIEGAVQLMTASESEAFAADGMSRIAHIYFSSDPQIDEKYFLKHTQRSDGSAVTPRWYRVLSVIEEGRPGQTLLWMAIAEQLTGAGEPEVST